MFFFKFQCFIKREYIMKWQFHNSLKILKQYYYVVFIQYKTWSWSLIVFFWKLLLLNEICKSIINHAVFSINLSIQFNSTSTVHTRIKSFLSFQVTINRSRIPVGLLISVGYFIFWGYQKNLRIIGFNLN